jgi:hypothetical protein
MPARALLLRCCRDKGGKLDLAAVLSSPQVQQALDEREERDRKKTAAAVSKWLNASDLRALPEDAPAGLATRPGTQLAAQLLKATKRRDGERRRAGSWLRRGRSRCSWPGWFMGPGLHMWRAGVGVGVEGGQRQPWRCADCVRCTVTKGALPET